MILSNENVTHGSSRAFSSLQVSEVQVEWVVVLRRIA